jgi:hypothetical protein
VHALAAEYTAALGRGITYVDVPFEKWCQEELRPRGLPEHDHEHLLTMAKSHAGNRDDLVTHDVEAILGGPATSGRDFAARNAASFAPRPPRETSHDASAHTLVAGAEFDEACERICWSRPSRSSHQPLLLRQGMAGNTLENLESTWNWAELPVKYGKRGSHKLLDGFILRFRP